MPAYAFDLHKAGPTFFTEVTLFCQAMGQPGREESVYKEVFGQVVASMSPDLSQFTGSLLMVPHWSTINYVSDYMDVNTPHAIRFKEACGVLCVQLNDIIIRSDKIPDMDYSFSFLLETVTLHTIVVQAFSDAPY